jgi:large subunit ribosomal protein L4
MRQAALRSALTVKAKSGDIVVLDKIEMSQPKTRDMVGILEKVAGKQSSLLLLGDRDENVEKSARNLPHVKILRANYLNIRDLLGHRKIVMPLAALEVIDGFLAPGGPALVEADISAEASFLEEEE